LFFSLLLIFFIGRLPLRFFPFKLHPTFNFFTYNLEVSTRSVTRAGAALLCAKTASGASRVSASGASAARRNPPNARRKALFGCGTNFARHTRTLTHASEADELFTVPSGEARMKNSQVPSDPTAKVCPPDQQANVAVYQYPVYQYPMMQNLAGGFPVKFYGRFPKLLDPFYGPRPSARRSQSDALPGGNIASHSQ